MRCALISTFIAASDVLADTDCGKLQGPLSGLECGEERWCSDGFTCNIQADSCDYTCEENCPSVILIGNAPTDEDLPGRQETSVLGEVCQSSAFEDRRKHLEHYKCSMSDEGLIVTVTVPDVVRLYDWDTRKITLIPKSVADKQDPKKPTTVFESIGATDQNACIGIASNGFVHFNVSQNENCRFDKSDFDDGMHEYKFTVGYDDLVDDTNPLKDGTFPVIKYGRQWDLSCSLDGLGADSVEVSASGDRLLDLMDDTEKIDFDLEVFGANDFKTPFTTKNIDPMVEEIPYAYFKASAFIKNEFPDDETDHFLHIKRCNAELIDTSGQSLQTQRLLFKGCKEDNAFADRNVLQYDRVLMDAYNSDYFRLHLWKPHGYGEYEFSVTCHMSVCTMADVLAGNKHCIDNCDRYDAFKSNGRKRRSTTFDESLIPRHEVSKTIRIKFLEHGSAPSPKIIHISDDIISLPDIEVLDNKNRFVPFDVYYHENNVESSGEEFKPEITLKISPDNSVDDEHRFPTEIRNIPENNFQLNNRNIALISIGIICINAFVLILIISRCKQN